MMVVIAHVVAPVRDQLHRMAALNWFIGSMFDGLSKVSVPLFIMISGALLLGREESIGAFYKKRFPRLLIPFFVWGLFYAFYERHETGLPFRPLDTFLTVLQNPPYYHLWYPYMLIGLYLITPFIQIMMRPITQHQLGILLLLWVIFRIILPHLYAELLIWFDYPFHFGFTLNGVDVYLGYYLLGFYMHRYGMPKLRFGMGICLYLMVSLLLTTAGYLLYRWKQQYDPLFLLSESPFVFVQAVLLFAAFRHKSRFPGAFIGRVATRIAALSFGIYLVHPILIDILAKGYAGFRLHARTMDTIGSVPITFIVVFGASFLFCFLLEKVPVVKRIIG